MHGTPMAFRSARDAIGAGIGMVFQHFQLMDNLSVLENVILGAEPVLRGGRIDFDAARHRIHELGERYGLVIDPDALVDDLPVGARQRLEILKVLYRGARILILDEPTGALAPQEIDDFFSSVRELTEEGVTVLFISHKLDEVLSAADTITVMRDGRTVARTSPEVVDAKELAELMVGAELPVARIERGPIGDQVVLEVKELTVERDGRNVVDEVDLVVRAGEMVGIAGVDGNGQHDLIEAILGLARPVRGQICLAGANITDRSTRQRRERGIALIPQDRHREGLLLEAPLWENAALGHQSVPPYAKGPWIDRAGTRARTEALVRDFDVRTPSIDVRAHALSGGNQQKLIIGREMESKPRLLIAAHPTRGVDVGAQAAIWDQLRSARDDGLAVLLVSFELDELLGLADSLFVMLRGAFVASLDPSTATRELVGAYMTGVAASPS